MGIMATRITWGKKPWEHVNAGDSCRRPTAGHRAGPHIHESENGGGTRTGERTSALDREVEGQSQDIRIYSRQQEIGQAMADRGECHIGQEPVSLLRLSVVSATLNCVQRSLLVMLGIKRGARIKPLLSMEGQLSTHCTIAAVPYTNWVNILVSYSSLPPAPEESDFISKKTNSKARQFQSQVTKF